MRLSCVVVLLDLALHSRCAALLALTLPLAAHTAAGCSRCCWLITLLQPLRWRSNCARSAAGTPCATNSASLALRWLLTLALQP